MANKAIDLFHEIPKPNNIIVTLLFKACGELGTDEALIQMKKVSSTMTKSFYFDSQLVTSLLHALMKCGDVTSAETFLTQSTRKELSMYGAMMKGNVLSFSYENDLLHFFV